MERDTTLRLNVVSRSIHTQGPKSGTCSVLDEECCERQALGVLSEWRGDIKVKDSSMHTLEQRFGQELTQPG